MTAAAMISAAALVGAVIALLMTLWQRRTLRVLRQQLQDMEATVSEIAEVLKDRPLASATSGFSAHLSDAEKNQHQNRQELKEKLQENNAAKSQGQADKYRYAVALAAQGQNVDSIAQALNMAPAEVEQVMQLSRVKRPI
ncbi:hypothetical protein [Pelovirga terrestris]|uniref:DUF2802 domain-containing protein n=1 Tax=Pelovirga terrestris TaxID=2771352 RepID=A0A8J6QQY2_9BACT|nr:hypothetical protein [Pelovirga terrestris]MBD1400448.1 hypothetical protein [Pelovirga terrestris]